MKRYLHLYILAILFCPSGSLFSQITTIGNCPDTSNYCIDAAPGSQWYWRDNDGDGIGSSSSGGQCIASSTPPSGFSSSCSDCNDNSSSVGDPRVWFIDNDNDGFGSNSSTQVACTRPSGYVDNSNDCNDNNPSIGASRTWYRDADNDGYGNPNVTTTSCSQPSGYVSNNDDCNDSNPNVQLNLYYRDADNDGFGDPNDMESACTQPLGYVSNANDCDDTNSFVNPNSKWYIDEDGDGFGNHSLGFVTQCEAVPGRATGLADCDDLNASINPNTVWYVDNDGDGIGDTQLNSIKQCSQPSGYVLELAGLDPVPEETLPDLSSIDINDLNYTYTIEPFTEVTSIAALNGLANSEKLETKSYHDGLGRAAQTIAMRQGGNGKDVVTYIEYDRFGRNVKNYLPFGRTSGTSGSFMIDAKVQQGNFYESGSLENAWAYSKYPYNETVFDRSPVNRSKRQGSSGASWKIGSGNEMEYDYELNASNEVRHFKVSLDANLNPTLEVDGYYNRNQLAVTISKDENWKGGVDHTTREYKNKEGQVILKRGYADGITLSTYYVYDDYGNLTYILPPKSEPQTNTFTNSILDELCFQYRYDGLRRQVSKRIPGVQGWEKIVYDREDRPVLVQDPKLALENKWLFTKYDKFGRVLYTGIHTTTSTQEALQTLMEGSTSGTNETRSSSSNIGGVQVGYSNTSYPTSAVSLLTVTYYDNYNFYDPNEPAMPSSVLGVSVTNNVKGMPVATWTRTIDENTWNKSYSYYDERGRILRAYSINHLGGHSYVDTEYDFRGKPLRTILQHKRLASSVPITTTDRFEYDGAERIRTHRQKVNAKPERILTGHVYDAVGKELVKYIEPQNEDFGYSFGPSGQGTSITRFNGEQMGSWSMDAGSNGNVTFTRDGLLVTMAQQGDAISGDYDLRSGSEHAVSMDISRQNFGPDLSLVVTYQGQAVHQENITTSGKFTTFFTPQQNGTYRFSLVMSSANTYGGNQSFVMDNAQIEYNTSASSYSWSLADINALQKIDYKYNSRGFLTSINEIKALGDDVFAYNIRYDNISGATSQYKRQYNGNISQIYWKTKTDNVSRNYKYAYDSLDRLYKAGFSDGNYNLNSVDYDKNGNITSLSRNLHNGSQQFNYQYDSGNKLIGLGGTEIIGTTPSTVNRSYSYDVNGNMTQDTGKNVSNITYNYLNLPERVTFTTGEIIEYDYTAGGTKLQKRFIDGGSTTITDYLGGYQYTNGNLEFMPQPEGYTLLNQATQELRYVYNYKDHLENVRVSYSDLDGNGAISPFEILRENNYYPFGLLHQGYNNTLHPLGSIFNYGFNGKELQEENGLAWMDFGSRNYDAELGRWFNTDPQSQFHSPYLYAFNNPINSIDPDGEFAITAIVAGAVIGALTAGTAYTVSAIQSNSWDWGAFAGSVIGGAIVGGISNGLAASGNAAILGGDAIGKAIIQGAVGSFTPSANIPIGDNFSIGLSPALAFGSSGVGLGGNISANAQVGDFNASYGFGASYYGKTPGTGKAGFESRHTIGGSYSSGDFSLSYYHTKFNDHTNKEITQGIGSVGIGIGDFYLRHDNDVFGDGGDRYRTAALEIGYKDFNAGFALFTGDPRLDVKQGDLEGFPGARANGANGVYSGANANRYRLGAGYVGYRGTRLGINSESFVRGAIQNGLHRSSALRLMFGQNSPDFPVQNIPTSLYGQGRTPNPFTLY